MKCRGKRLSKLINVICTGGKGVRSTDEGQKEESYPPHVGAV